MILGKFQLCSSFGAPRIPTGNVPKFGGSTTKSFLSSIISQPGKIVTKAPALKSIDLWQKIKMKTIPKSNAKLRSLAPEFKSMDILMNMTGLESVKKSFLDVYHHANISKKQGLDFENTNYNLRLDGNPGTGNLFLSSSIIT